MNGGLGNNADGSGSDEILGTCIGRSHKPSGREGSKKEDHCGGVQISLGRCDMDAYGR